MLKFKVNDKVKAVAAIYDYPDDHSPGGNVAEKGDILIVRTIRENAKTWPYSVSHEYRTDGATFSCSESEIEAFFWKKPRLSQ